MKSTKTLVLLPSLLLAGVTSLIAETASDRLQESAVMLNEILSAPDRSIPRDLLDDAHCVVVVPGMKNAAFLVGARYGRGFAVCRREKRLGWGAPAAVRIEGGSFGFQIGASETDVVMLIMNRRGMDKLLQSRFTLGGAAEVAAGPVGRSSTAQTDAAMTAKILSWSRSRGVFAGVSLQGATLRQDLDENEELYGHRITNKQIVMKKVKSPAAAAELIAVLNHHSRRESVDE
jgi:lipid-binding SYLF domain-containing protein